MRVAVTSQNFHTVTGHAGRARRFIVFEANERDAPQEVGRLDLDADMAIHGFDPNLQHPLDGMDVLITGGAGEGFVRHLAARGVRVVATGESNPQLAVVALLAGRTTPASEHCNHDHGNPPNFSGDDTSTTSQGCNCHH